jgi:hypothetical protein
VEKSRKHLLTTAEADRLINAAAKPEFGAIEEATEGATNPAFILRPARSRLVGPQPDAWPSKHLNSSHLPPSLASFGARKDRKTGAGLAEN